MENGNEDSLSEAHLKSSITSRGFYLDLEVSIFVKIFEFYLVTQSLKKETELLHLLCYDSSFSP
jgi:hypothetical protein